MALFCFQVIKFFFSALNSDLLCNESAPRGSLAKSKNIFGFSNGAEWGWGSNVTITSWVGTSSATNILNSHGRPLQKSYLA